MFIFFVSLAFYVLLIGCCIAMQALGQLLAEKCGAGEFAERFIGIVFFVIPLAASIAWQASL